MRITLFLIAILSLNSCQSKNEDRKEANPNRVVFYNLRARLGGFTKDTFNIRIENAQHYSKLTYNSLNNSQNYLFFLSEDLNYVLIDKDTTYLKYCCSNLFRFDEKKSFRVDVYSVLNRGIDGGELFYFNKDLGLILNKSVAWYSNKRLLNFIDNDSLTIFANILSDQCLMYDDWSENIRSCR